MIYLKERFRCSASVIVGGFGRPICIIDSDGMETYNELRSYDERTIILGVDTI